MSVVTCSAAVGFIVHPPWMDDAEGERMRSAVVAAAAAEGLQIADVVVVTRGEPDELAAALAGLHELVEGSGAQTLITAGGLSPSLLDSARQLALRVITTPLSRLEPEQLTLALPAPWTGPLEFDLGRGLGAVLVVVDVEPETVRLVFNSDTFGVLDRGRVRFWLHQNFPGELTAGDSRWFWDGDALQLIICDSNAYTVPPATVAELRARV